MGVNSKMCLFLLLIAPLIAWGQDAPFPKDTIYVKYENKKGTKKWPGKFEEEYNHKCGLFFNVLDDHKKGMALFYPYSQPRDTLALKRITNYHFSDLKEIDEKRYSWVFDNNRPPLTRNGVFQTYLIEVINDSQFVIYPVIWRNEGATP